MNLFDTDKTHQPSPLFSYKLNTNPSHCRQLINLPCFLARHQLHLNPPCSFVTFALLIATFLLDSLSFTRRPLQATLSIFPLLFPV